MALSLDYVVRETAGNLRRNLLMTSAAVLTVAVSLFLVGGALLIKQGVSRATIQWRGGVELSIFMQPDATPDQAKAVEAELAKMPEVKKTTYVDQDAAYDEFKKMFANEPDMVDSVTPKDLPPSYRVVPRQPQFVTTIGDRFNKFEGVKKVVYAKDTVKTLITITDFAQWAFLILAIILGLSAAVLLIGTTIRLAIHARQREVAVMKLVGATNWFIRVPFMLEGMVQGVAGAFVAFCTVYAFRNFFSKLFADPAFDTPLRRLFVTPHEAVITGLVLFVVGAGAGVFGSAFAVRRFLTV